jgi:hypothetical protein
MKISCHVGWGNSNSTDQWMSCRGEGRAIINLGLGLGAVGQEVDIICDTLENKNDIIPGVNLRSSSDTSKIYDIAFSFNSFPCYTNYKKLCFYPEISHPHEYHLKTKQEHPGIIFVVQTPRIFKLVENGAFWQRNFKIGEDIKWLNSPYPVPCLPGLAEWDFLPYKFDVKKKDIKIWAWRDSWKGGILQGEWAIPVILKRLRDVHGFRIDLYLHMSDTNFRTNETNEIIREFNPTLIDNYTLTYRSMLDMFQSMDLCIGRGTPHHASGGPTDIISLGKPMLYIVDGSPDNPLLINDFVSLKNYICRLQSGIGGINSTVDRFVSAPEEFYNVMKEANKIYIPSVWKENTRKFLSSLNIGNI